jgi:hypothetical protein
MRKHSIMEMFLASALAFPALAVAQDAHLKLDLGNLASRAKETVNISIDKTTVGWAMQALNAKGGDADKLRDIMKDLEAITVQALEFEKDKAPSTDELMDAAKNAMRELDGPRWKTVISANEKHDNGNEVVRVSLWKNAAGEVEGLAILALEPGEIVLVNVVGKIRLDQIGELGKALGHPGMFGALGGNAATQPNPTPAPKPKQ